MRPTTFTPEQAIARSRSWSTYPKLLCANHVWRAYLGGSPSQDSGKNPSDNGYSNSVWGSATAAWNNTPAAHKHAGDRNPPFGALVFYGGAGDGHVVLSLGDGRVRSTDYLSSGRIGEATIDQIGSYVRRPYLGWTNWLGGYIADLTPAAPTLRPGSRISLDQAQQLAAWLARPYNSRDYIFDIQLQGIWRGIHPANGHDGVYGSVTANTELILWEQEFNKKPEPTPEPEPVEPPIVDPKTPEPTTPVEPPIDESEPPVDPPSVNLPPRVLVIIGSIIVLVLAGIGAAATGALDWIGRIL